jgi:DNA mismatch endonuclease (patch repair protein)
MVDIMSKSMRSRLMSKIRGKGNRTTEMALLHLLKLHKVKGWRRHLKLRGRPDFAFKHARVAVFVDGCFWHACPLCQKPLASRNAYWQDKLLRNRQRDRQVSRALRSQGWCVIRIRECRLIKLPDQEIGRIWRALKSRATTQS